MDITRCVNWCRRCQWRSGVGGSDHTAVHEPFGGTSRPAAPYQTLTRAPRQPDVAVSARGLRCRGQHIGTTLHIVGPPLQSGLWDFRDLEVNSAPSRARQHYMLRLSCVRSGAL